MSQFKWCGYKWNTNERWGICHPDRPYCWYDESCVSIDASGNLNLICRYDPKTITNSEGVTMHPEFGVGLVSSDASNPKFRYGRYTWVAKLPKGKNLWPALWMWSFDSWPPEIDVVEAWTNCSGSYYKFPLDWKVTTNVHFKENGSNKNIKSKSVLMTKMPDPTKNFNEYELIWLPDRLDFRYNKKNIRSVEDPKLMKYINDNTQSGMNIIMNNHITADYDQKTPSEPLIVKSFNYVSY